MQTIDYSQEPKQILIDIINFKNNITLDVGDFEFSLPQSLTPQQPGLLDHNTKVTLTALAGSGYYGARDIYYNRLDFGTIFSSLPLTIVLTDEETLSELIPLINETYDLHIRPEDYEDTVIPPVNPLLPNAPRSVTILAKDSSLIFRGTYTFVFNPNANPVVDDDEVERKYYLLVDGLPFSEIRQSFISLNSDATPNTAFNFLVNASNIVEVNILRVERNQNGIFVLIGDFTLDYTIGSTVVQVVDVHTLLVSDVNGAIVSHTSQPYFLIDVNTKLYSNNAITKKYAIIPDDLYVQSHFYRFNSDGLIDRTYAPAITYQPKFVRVLDSGKVYIVSEAYNGPDILNNNALTNLIRIDRLLPDGAFDPEFNTIYLRSSNPASQPIPVMDLLPLSNGDFYLAFLPLYGTDVGSNYPIINGEAIVTADGTAGATYSWSPVVKFDESGVWDRTFISTLLGYKDKMLYEHNGSQCAIDINALTYKDEVVTFMTYRRNPITGYDHRQPVQFTIAGRVKYLSGIDYENQFKWTNLIDFIPQSNGEFLGYGNLQTYQHTGSYSIAYSGLARYKKNGTIDRVIWRSPGPTGTSNPTLRKVFLDQKVI